MAARRGRPAKVEPISAPISREPSSDSSTPSKDARGRPSKLETRTWEAYLVLATTLPIPPWTSELGSRTCYETARKMAEQFARHWAADK